MQREATYTSRCRDVHRACMRGGGAAVCRAACVRSIAWNAMGHCQTRDGLECELMAGMFIPQLSDLHASGRTGRTRASSRA